MALPMKVIQSIEFDPISEEYLAELLRKDIEKQLPEGAVITKIEFNRKLQPTRIEADVTATFNSVPASLANNESPKAPDLGEEWDVPTLPEDKKVEPTNPLTLELTDVHVTKEIQDEDEVPFDIEKEASKIEAASEEAPATKPMTVADLLKM